MLFFFTYKEDNDIINSIFQFEGQRYCSISALNLGKRQITYSYGKRICVLR